MNHRRPLTERCRLLSVQQLPRSGNEAWTVATPAGRRGLINLTCTKGERGQTLLLTYTPHANLLIAAELVADE